MSLMAALRAASLANMTMPAGRFFKPTEAFWSALKAAVDQGIHFIDCGAGSGELIDEARARGIPLAGVDICKREGQSEAVIQGDATMITWSPKLWPLLCRPSYDGFANEIVDHARSQGATTWFICKPSSFQRHLAGYPTKKHDSVVGLEDDRLYIIKPRSPEAERKRRHRRSFKYLKDL